MKWKNVYHDNMNTLKRLKVLYFGLNYGFQIIMVKLVVNRKDCCMFHILTVQKNRALFVKVSILLGYRWTFFLCEWFWYTQMHHALLKTSLQSIAATQLTCIPIGTQLTCIPVMVSKARCEGQKSCYHTSFPFLLFLYLLRSNHQRYCWNYLLHGVHTCTSPGWTMICLQSFEQEHTDETRTTLLFRW